MSDYEVSGGMMGSASAKCDDAPLPLSELIKSSIKRSSHATAIVKFKRRFSKDTQYALYFVSDACGLTQHLCLVDLDGENPYQVAVIIADRDALKDMHMACEKALALIDAMGYHKGPMSVGEELNNIQKDWPKEGWSKGDDVDYSHYCNMTDGKLDAVCGNWSSFGRIHKLSKKPRGKKCPDCVEEMKRRREMKYRCKKCDYVEMEPGWIERGFKSAEEDIKKWPKWMKREAGVIR